MWEPSFYEQWMSRYREVSKLKVSAEFLAYAKLHNIKYIVMRVKYGECSQGSIARFRNEGYLFCEVL